MDHLPLSVSKNPVENLNKEIGVSVLDCKYVLLLMRTKKFNLLQDISNTLRISRKHIVWFIQQFRKHGVRVEYATLFPEDKISKLGSIAKHTSNEIVSILLQETYGTDITLVCFNKTWLGNKKRKIITTDTFSDMLLKYANSDVVAV